jgi:hypothetical protein
MKNDYPDKRLPADFNVEKFNEEEDMISCIQKNSIHLAGGR